MSCGYVVEVLSNSTDGNRSTSTDLVDLSTLLVPTVDQGNGK